MCTNEQQLQLAPRPESGDEESVTARSGAIRFVMTVLKHDSLLADANVRRVIGVAILNAVRWAFPYGSRCERLLSATSYGHGRWNTS